MNQLFLYEWKWVELPSEIDAEDLKRYLSSVWQSRKYLFDQEDIEETEEDASDIKRYKQGFLRFDGNYISAKNYVGFIQYNGTGINILPKVFANSYPSPDGHTNKITAYLLEWLSYSTRIRFPFSEVSFEEQRFDQILEPFIFIFADYTSRLLEKLPFQCYEEMTERTPFLKGRLAVNNYINESLVKGNFHHLISTYDSFEFNNQFNQIIKCVTRLLLRSTSNDFSWKKLQQILFILDEVDDMLFTSMDCDKIHFSRIYRDWETTLNMCRMFLSGQSFKSQQLKKSNFCFLVPMELVYEEYVAGILEKHSDKKVHRQPRFKFLTEERLFQLKPDLIYDNTLVIDTKYKLLDESADDGKYSVSQGDLYQMLAYAIRYEKSRIVLLYPNDHLNNSNPFLKSIQKFEILEEFSHQSITIEIKQIDIFKKSVVRSDIAF